jgi:hypothetical protein
MISYGCEGEAALVPVKPLPDFFPGYPACTTCTSNGDFLAQLGDQCSDGLEGLFAGATNTSFIVTSSSRNLKAIYS